METEDVPAGAEILGEYGGMCLARGSSVPKGASGNMAFSVAEDFGLDGPDIEYAETVEEVSCEGNAFTNLDKALEDAPKSKLRARKPYTVALIDTGAPDGQTGVSMLGDDGADRHEHATAMADAMRSVYPDVNILPIKALDDKGHGDASTIYAAIQYAIAQDVDAINLSLYGYATEGNAAVEKAIKEAVKRGITVVGAAGNDGADAKYYLPGRVEEAVIVGACDEGGKILPISNYGETVDLYLPAGSTSEAAVKFSGYLAQYGGNMEKAFSHGLAAKNPDGGKPANPSNGFQAAAKTVEIIDTDAKGMYAITDYEYFDYFLYGGHIKADDVRIVNKPNGSHWKKGTVEIVSGTDANGNHKKNSFMAIYCDTSFGAGTTKLSGADSSVTLRFPNAVIGPNGVFYDLDITVDNIYYQKEVGKSGMLLMKLKNGELGTFYSMSLWADHTVSPWNLGSTFDVTYKVTKNGAAVSGSMVLAFSDIDQPYKPEKSYSGGTYPHESVTLLDGHYMRSSGNTAWIYVSKKKSNGTANCTLGITKNADGSVKLSPTCETGEANQPSVEDSGFSVLCKASGTKIRWSGSNCGTMMGHTWSYYITAKTRVRHQAKDGSYNNFTEVDSRVIFKNDNRAYKYTWNASGNAHGVSQTNTAIYKKTSESVDVEVLEANITHDITVNRHSYAYKFHGNKPAAAKNSVTDIPNEIKKLAENIPGAVGNPKLKGYKFMGWYDTSAATGGTAYNPNESMLSNKNFYARWEPQKYYVAYNANGSTNFNHENGEFTQNKTAGTMANSTFYYDTAGTLTANAYTREGFVFAGWNTAPDGSGTFYNDQYANVLNWTDVAEGTVTLYAQWTKLLGNHTLTVVSEETGNRVPGVTVKLYKNVDGTWVDTGVQGTTNAQGQVSAGTLRWFNYEWRSVSVPAGYRGMTSVPFATYPNCTVPGSLCSHTSGTRPSSAAAALATANTRILYMKHVSLKLNSTVSELIGKENPPAFFYHVEGRDAAGVRHAYDVMVQAGISLTGSNTVPDMFAGTYKVTQTPISRYNPGSSQAVSYSAPDGINANADLLDVPDGSRGEITFPYTIRQMGGFGSYHSETNRLTR